MGVITFFRKFWLWWITQSKRIAVVWTSRGSGDMQTIAVLQVTFESHQKVDHSSYLFRTLAPFSKLPDNIFKLLNSTPSMALMLSRPCSSFLCWPGQYFKTLYSCLSLKWLNAISLQYDTYCLIILAATILRTTLGILIVSPEDNFSVLVPWATSWTKWGLDMNPVKWSILGEGTLTRYLGIAGKGCPLPYEIKCFLAWNSWYFVISGSISWICRYVAGIYRQWLTKSAT